MKRFIQNCLLLCLVAGLLELASAVLLQTVIGSEQLQAASSGAESGTKDAVRELLAGSLTIPHPYLGFVYDPREGLKHAGVPISSYGLIDDKPPIQKRSPNKVLIGVFGGSVAWWLQSLGERAIREELDKSPAYRGKEVVFVRLALGAYKQPQQLQALTYLLALGGELDIAVNIDGYNDVGLFEPNERRFPFFPEYWDKMLGAFSSRAELSLIGRIEALKEERESLLQFLATSPAGRSRTVKLVCAFWDRRLRSKLEHYRAELQTAGDRERQLSPAILGPELRFSNTAQYYEKVATVWEQSSRLMEQISTAHHIRYFHFLQPNQYFPGSKTLDEKERTVAIDPGSPRVQRVASGYPHLREHGRRLTASGVRFTDASQVFAETTEATYVDDCCHLTERGNEIFGHLVGKTLAEGAP